MFRAVQAACTSNGSAWGGFVAFENVFNDFSAKLIALSHVIFEQGKGTTGVRLTRDEEREETAKKAEKIVYALRLYALATGNTVLKEQLRFPPSSLEYGSSSETIQLIGVIVEAATLHAAALADYLVTQAEIDDLTQRHLDLQDAFGSVRSAIVNRSKNTDLIDEQMRELSALLKDRLDPLVALLKDDHPDFATVYAKARSIVDYKGKKNKHGDEYEGPDTPDDTPDLPGEPGGSRS